MAEAQQPAEGGAKAASPSAPLDEVMLAMDVVDTLRHADKLVERELAADERDRQLKDRLRHIYASQGIEVPERVLEEGVTALKQDRFVYDPPKAGGRWWALLWIRRKVWGKFVLIGLALIVAAGAGYHYLIKVPAEQAAIERVAELESGLPRRLDDELARIRAVAREDRAVSEAEALAAQGLAAARAGDLQAGRAAAAAMEGLRQRLEQEYVVRIVTRPGEPSGVFRIPEANPDARNYYLIVEAVDAEGRPAAVPVTSEESNVSRTVETWGQRVTERTFAAIRADKSDDGIIDNNILGVKRRGVLTPEYAMPVRDGAILEW